MEYTECTIDNQITDREYIRVRVHQAKKYWILYAMVLLLISGMVTYIGKDFWIFLVAVCWIKGLILYYVKSAKWKETYLKNPKACGFGKLVVSIWGIKREEDKAYYDWNECIDMRVVERYLSIKVTTKEQWVIELSNIPNQLRNRIYANTYEKFHHLRKYMNREDILAPFSEYLKHIKKKLAFVALSAGLISLIIEEVMIETLLDFKKIEMVQVDKTLLIGMGMIVGIFLMEMITILAVYSKYSTLVKGFNGKSIKITEEGYYLGDKLQKWDDFLYMIEEKKIFKIYKPQEFIQIWSKAKMTSNQINSMRKIMDNINNKSKSIQIEK